MAQVVDQAVMIGDLPAEVDLAPLPHRLHPRLARLPESC
jgi:hypothetical protein